MLELQRKALNQAIMILDKLNARYFIEYAGEKFGELEILEIKPKRERLYARGALKDYITPYLTEMEEGQVICVPYDRFQRDHLHSALCSHAHRLFGTGNYTTHCSADGIQVFKCANYRTLVKEL